MRTIRFSAALFAIAGLALSAPVGAGAATHPPRVSLTAGALHLRGSIWSYIWLSPRGPNSCSGEAVDGIPRYAARPPSAGDATVARIALHSGREPSQVTIDAHRRLNRAGRPAGPVEHLQVSLSPYAHDGRRTAWVASVALHQGRRYYLDLFARYSYQGKCGDEGGDMSVAFSLRTTAGHSRTG